MARVLWKDRIGETKEVQGITFTIVDNEGDTVIVEAGDDLYFIARNTWREGKFTKILRKLKPKFLGEQKEVQGITFKVVDIIEGKLVVEAKSDLFFMTPKTWEGGKFTVALRKLKPRFVGESKGIDGLLAKVFKYAQGKVELEVEANGKKHHFTIGANTWVKGIFKKLRATFKKLGLIGKTVYFLSVISNKPINADIIKKHVHTIENAFYKKDLKEAFRKIANVCHPDHGGSVKLFQEIKKVYDLQAYAIEAFEEINFPQKVKEGTITEEKYRNLIRKFIKTQK